MNAPTPEKVVIGQKLWYVPRELRRADPREVTVTKVGRKWADVSGGHGRINVETLEVDGRGYSSPGKCWRSREEYEAYDALCKAWDELRTLLSRHWSPPAGVTLNQVANAKRSLFKGEK